MPQLIRLLYNVCCERNYPFKRYYIQKKEKDLEESQVTWPRSHRKSMVELGLCHTPFCTPWLSVMLHILGVLQFCNMALSLESCSDSRNSLSCCTTSHFPSSVAVIGLDVQSSVMSLWLQQQENNDQKKKKQQVLYPCFCFVSAPEIFSDFTQRSPHV